MIKVNEHYIMELEDLTRRKLHARSEGLTLAHAAHTQPALRSLLAVVILQNKPVAGVPADPRGERTDPRAASRAKTRPDDLWMRWLSEADFPATVWIPASLVPLPFDIPPLSKEYEGGPTPRPPSPSRPPFARAHSPVRPSSVFLWHCEPG